MKKSKPKRTAWSRFAVSDKIVCINAQFEARDIPDYTTMPRHGVVYVVREMDFSSLTLEQIGEAGVLLVGIRGVVRKDGERCFRPDRFRKLEDIRAENATLANVTT